MRRPTNLINGLDWVTIVLYLVLVLMGWLNIYAAVYDDQNASILSMSQRYGKQLIWIITAIALATIVCLIDARFYSTFAYPIYIVGLLILMSVLIVGREVNGAKAWFYFAGLQIQPAEFAKIATSLALAKYVGNYSGRFLTLRNMVNLGALLALPVGLILLQPDLGSCLIYAAFLLVLYREGLPTVLMLLLVWVAALALITLAMQGVTFQIVGLIVLVGFLVYGYRSRKIKFCLIGMAVYATVFIVFIVANQVIDGDFELSMLMVSAAVATGLFLVLVSVFKRLAFIRTAVFFVLLSLVMTFGVHTVFEMLPTHQQDRILVMLSQKSDPLGIEYNVNQSKIAIGSGGWSGKGFLQGTQTKFNFVPEQSTDFIFCTVGEEWGFLGALVVLTLFVFLLLRLIYLAERQRSVFSRVYGYCVVTILFFHFFINIGMAIDILPVIGIPLPFFSYGGSSLWAFTILLFIFLRLDFARDEYIH